LPDFDFWQGKIFLFSTASRLVLGPMQPSVFSILRMTYPGVKWPGLEGDYSPASSVEVRNGRAIISFPHMSSWHSV
jgi:hypothetical protein